ncbi:MAG: CBS domain-containing protein [Deltaproteobacteria bacterium]|nr:CBS domain-containing protein [Deltaproteobacteria bacterium]MBW2505302.1 CBS domain-containing protein [Deltaproteobacteria bacterium]MBW2519626.1 CBS domain-containing protein [Deltaproteobacteria bacterium]
MAEGNLLFQPIKNYCSHTVATCSLNDTVQNVAIAMRQRGISSMVVCEDSQPVGILTDRDLRNKVVAQGVDPAIITAADIMNAPLITVDEDDFIFEALYLISRNNIHRVCVVDKDNRLTGIITDSDILRLQTHSPQKLVRDIEEAATINELKERHKQIQGLVLHLVGTGVPTRDLVTMIAHLNDQLLLRLITLLRAQQFSDLTDRFAFIVLGSEGRREQTLTTDQDNAIIYDDDLTDAEINRIVSFSQALIDSLIEIGVPPCPGGIMAKNDTWRRSYGEWNEALKKWLATPTPENILKGSMFFDLRTIYGDPKLEHNLKAWLSDYFQKEKAFLVHSAANAVRFKTPVGFFGRIKTERDGEHRGQLDVKKAGIFAITEGIKALALEAGITNGGTRERLHALVKAGMFKQSFADDLEASYNFLVFLRLRCQVEAIRANQHPTNYITLAKLNHMEKGRLKLAFEEVDEFQEFLSAHFRLHLLRR